VLGPENSLVTTMVPGSDGVARRAVVPGAYRVRIVHPDFVETERDVQVLADAKTELNVVLPSKPRTASVAAQRPAARPARGGGSVDEATRAVDRGISEGRRWLGRFGF
jgi:hypothetical protein